MPRTRRSRARRRINNSRENSPEESTPLMEGPKTSEEQPNADDNRQESASSDSADINSLPQQPVQNKQESDDGEGCSACKRRKLSCQCQSLDEMASTSAAGCSQIQPVNENETLWPTIPPDTTESTCLCERNDLAQQWFEAFERSLLECRQEQFINIPQAAGDPIDTIELSSDSSDNEETSQVNEDVDDGVIVIKPPSEILSASRSSHSVGNPDQGSLTPPVVVIGESNEVEKLQRSEGSVIVIPDSDDDENAEAAEATRASEQVSGTPESAGAAEKQVEKKTTKPKERK